MNRIHVEIDMLESTERTMQEQSDYYRQLYGQMYEMVDEMSQFWSGKEQVAFSKQIHGFEDDFEKMHQLLNEYCSFLRKSALAYRSCQDEAESSATRLVQ